MRKALVFGGSGQLGVPVIDRLLAEDWEVVALSRSPQAARERLHWLRGDLQHAPELPAQVEAIFSLGPLDHFARWYAQAEVMAPRVVAFGSTSIDTKQASADAHERDLALRLGEAESRLFARAGERRSAATVLRPTLVYGAARDLSLTRIAQLARRTGFFVLPRDANGLRQPVHVQDLADAAMAVLDSEAAAGRSYALPGGETLGYAQMVERVLAALRPPARLLRVPAPAFRAALATAHALGLMRGPGDAAVARMAEDLVFDAQAARRDFGYAPRPFDPTAAMFSLSAHETSRGP